MKSHESLFVTLVAIVSIAWLIAVFGAVFGLWSMMSIGLLIVTGLIIGISQQILIQSRKLREKETND
jgi:hypothetical protein